MRRQFATVACVLVALIVGAIGIGLTGSVAAQAGAVATVADEAVLVKDIYPGPQGSTEAGAQRFVDVSGTVFLRANDGVHGDELWKSDGTEAGTVLVKDVALGDRSSAAWPLTVANQNLFFTASQEDDPEVKGREPWTTKGTEASTKLVKDIRSGPEGSHPLYATALTGTAVIGTVFFDADDGVHGTELWKSDWTTAGTVLVRDIYAGRLPSNPYKLTIVGTRLFFVAGQRGRGSELWKSNGTQAGTVLVKDINPGSGDGPNSLTDILSTGGTAFFGARDGVHGSELWKSDGTEAGTVLVKDVEPGAGSGLPNGVWHGAVVDGTLYFGADDGVNGYALWRSDGTEAGTVLVKEVANDALTPVGSTFFFIGGDAEHGGELWKSDGTEAGTGLVKDISPGPQDSYLDELTAVGDRLFFRADDGVSGSELWTSDGTEAGTALVRDIKPGPAHSSPYGLTHIADTLFFTADDGVNGRELWKVETQ